MFRMAQHIKRQILSIEIWKKSEQILCMKQMFFFTIIKKMVANQVL